MDSTIRLSSRCPVNDNLPCKHLLEVFEQCYGGEDRGRMQMVVLYEITCASAPVVHELNF